MSLCIPINLVAELKYRKITSNALLLSNSRKLTFYTYNLVQFNTQVQSILLLDSESMKLLPNCLGTTDNTHTNVYK